MLSILNLGSFSLFSLPESIYMPYFTSTRLILIVLFYVMFYFLFHWVKCVRIRSCSGPHFSCIFRIWTEYGEIRSISPYLVQMWENEEKMRTRITCNTDTFYAVFMSSNSLIYTFFYTEIIYLEILLFKIQINLSASTDLHSLWV